MSTNQNLYAAFQAVWLDDLDTAKSAPALRLPDGQCVSYARLDLQAGHYAAALDACGVGAGDRVVVQVDKSVDAVCLYLGCLRAGAVFVPLNTAYTAAEVDYFLNDSTPALFVCRASDYADRQAGAQAAGARAVRSLGSTANGDASDHDLASLAAACAPAAVIAQRSATDLAAICYTSGTTGRSKGAMLTHGNLSSNARTLLHLWGFQPGDVLLHMLPVFHVHGLFVALNTSFLNRSEILFEAAFDAERAMALLARSTVMMGVPTYYSRLLALDGFGPQACAHMRLFISGSAPLTAQVHSEFEARTGQRILERYGMTETGMITSNPLDGERVAGTVGFALPGVEIRVANEDGSLARTGEIGTVEVRGPNVFAGYWQMPEKTAQEFRADGFFITGDLGSLDAEGRLTLVGRGKDLIISGGYNIYPKEIESVLDDLAGVAESAVIGVPHADFGEGVVAVLVADAHGPTPQPAMQAALDATLARFKHPRRFFWVDSLPRNAMGKVQKAALREAYASAYAD